MRNIEEIVELPDEEEDGSGEFMEHGNALANQQRPVVGQQQQQLPATDKWHQSIAYQQQQQLFVTDKQQHQQQHNLLAADQQQQLPVVDLKQQQQLKLVGNEANKKKPAAKLADPATVVNT